MHAKAVILSAGLGTRLRPITDKTPKCLVSICDRPLLDYWIDALQAAGVSTALVNTHHLREQVVNHIAEVNARGAVELLESHEKKLLGSAGTLSANAGFAADADNIFIVYADNFSDIDLKHMLDSHRTQKNQFTMALFQTPTPSACGIVELDENGTVTDFQEKPAIPRSNLANAGIYIVTRPMYERISHMNGFDLATDILPALVGEMNGYVFDGYHRDIGTLDALNEARQHLDTPLG